MSNRKRAQVLNCKYGFQWPLNLHRDGFVVMLSKDDYIWLYSHAACLAIAHNLK